MRLHLATALAVATLGIAAASSASAQGLVRAGTLSCQGGGQSSWVLGSQTDMMCTFYPTTGGAERYTATIRRWGVDVGATSANYLGWWVLAPTNTVAPGGIAGGYGGVAAGATVGVGGTANVLVGGSNNTFALQPVSLHGSNGAAVVATIAGLELRPVVMRGRRR